MLMGKTPKNQSLSKPLLLLLGVLFPSLCFVCYQGFGLSPFLVSFPVMILSALFLFKFTKKKPASTNEINQLSSQNNFHEVKVKGQLYQEGETQKQAKNELEPISECFEENETAQISENGTESEGLELEDFPSESEVSDTSEDFEPKWNMSSTNVGQNMAIYECSFSEDEEDDDDDDNLIEISLPGGDSTGFDDKPRQNLPDFLPESIFSQKGFVELLADMNEEDNLIEIDLSIGSIKCPRFGIKA